MLETGLRTPDKTHVSTADLLQVCVLAGASPHDDPLEVGGQRGHDCLHVPLQPRHHQGGKRHLLSPSLGQLAADPANTR